MPPFERLPYAKLLALGEQAAYRGTARLLRGNPSHPCSTCASATSCPRGSLRPRGSATLRIERRNGRRDSVPLLLGIDTPVEAAYFSAGGILPYVLEQVADGAA